MVIDRSLVNHFATSSRCMSLHGSFDLIYHSTDQGFPRWLNARKRPCVAFGQSVKIKNALADLLSRSGPVNVPRNALKKPDQTGESLSAFQCNFLTRWGSSSSRNTLMVVQLSSRRRKERRRCVDFTLFREIESQRLRCNETRCAFSHWRFRPWS